MLLASSGHNFIQFLFTLVCFVAILFATYYVSKWIAGYQKTQMSNRNFEIIDSMRVSNNKYIMIVRIGNGRYFAVGVGKDEFTKLGEFSEDEVILFNTDSNSLSGRGSFDFKSLVGSFKQDKETSEHHEDE